MRKGEASLVAYYVHSEIPRRLRHIAFDPEALYEIADALDIHVKQLLHNRPGKAIMKKRGSAPVFFNLEKDIRCPIEHGLEIFGGKKCDYYN